MYTDERLLHSLNQLKARYDGGDLSALTEGLLRLGHQVGIPAWFFDALRQCVLDSMKRQTVNRKSNRYKQLAAAAEDYWRWYNVNHLLAEAQIREERLSNDRAYTSVANKRGMSR
jgi:hypothetical protein